jgi:hypothetical protein
MEFALKVAIRFRSSRYPWGASREVECHNSGDDRRDCACAGHYRIGRQLNANQKPQRLMNILKTKKELNESQLLRSNNVQLSKIWTSGRLH